MQNIIFQDNFVKSDKIYIFTKSLTQNYNSKVEERDREELFSKRIRAGKRTYFFDVKSTRSNDYYITITESRRYQKDDGFGYEKHKMFLYKEDFGKFMAGLQEAVDYVKTELLPDVDFTQFDREDEERMEYKPTETKEEDSSFGSDLKWE